MEEKLCPECGGTGWVLKEIQGRVVAQRCRCYKKQKSHILLAQANIPKRYQDCSFRNFEIHNESHRTSMKISKQFIKNYPVQDVGLLFIGPCGVGKTHLAIAIIKECMKKKRIPCYFCDFRELIRDIQRSYNRDSSLNEVDVLSPVFQKEILILDELGAKRTTAWVEETVFYIINKRYNQKKLTLFTSNYLDSEEEEDQRVSMFKNKDDSLVDRIGIRLRSRIYEMCKVVEMWGEDYRKEFKQGSYRF